MGEGRQALAVFLKQPMADPALAVPMAALCPTKKEARQWLERALERGFCGQALGRAANRLGDTTLMGRWLKRRRASLPRLGAAVRRLRWMGLQKAAADAAATLVEVLLQKAPLDELQEAHLQAVRAAAPALLTGNRRKHLLRLLSRPGLAATIREALARDQILSRYYPEVIRPFLKN